MRFVLGGPRNLYPRVPSYLLTHRRFSSDMAATINKTAHTFDKGRLDALLNRRFFYAPAFEIYGGTPDIILDRAHHADRIV